MTYNVDYLRRGIDRRVKEFTESAIGNIEKMIAFHASRGVLGSGSTLRKFQEFAVGGLEGWFSDTTTFVYSVTERHDAEVTPYLDKGADVLCQALYEYTRQRGRNTGINEKTVETQVAGIRDVLLARKAELLEDFLHGMLGSTKMKKDPLVSLTASQTNSPGAIQQVAVASNQNAQIQNFHQIVRVVEEIIQSDEFKALTPKGQIDFKDVAEVVKEEAGKGTPDVGKLRRWLDKLQGVASELGMKVTTSTIAQLISKYILGL